MSSTELDVYNPCPIDIEDIFLCEIPCVNHVLSNNNPVLYYANMFNHPNLMYFFEKIKAYDSPIFDKKNKTVVLESLNKFSIDDLECILTELENVVFEVKKERNILYIYKINKENINSKSYTKIAKNVSKTMLYYVSGIGISYLLNNTFMNCYLSLAAVVTTGIIYGFSANNAINALLTHQRFKNIVSAINTLDLYAKYDAKLEGLNYISNVVSDLLKEKKKQALNVD